MMLPLLLVMHEYACLGVILILLLFLFFFFNTYASNNITPFNHQ